MTQRQINKRVVQNYVQDINFEEELDEGPTFPVHKVMALPESKSVLAQQKPSPVVSPVSPVSMVHPDSPYSTISQRGRRSVVVAPKMMMSPVIVNGQRVVRTTPPGMAPVGYYSVPRYSSAARRQKQIIGDSVFFVKPGEELVKAHPGRSRRPSGASTISQLPRGRRDERLSVSSNLSDFSLPDKSTKLKKRSHKSADWQNQYWAAVDDNDSVFEHTVYPTADKDSLHIEPPTQVEGRPKSTGGPVHYTERTVVRPGSCDSRSTPRPSTVSASSFSSRRSQSILDPDYYYRPPSSSSPQYYTARRNSERLIVNRATGEVRVMDYGATTLPRGMTIYRPSSEVALYPQVSYYQPVQYDTYSRASSTTLVKSKVFSTSMPHLHKAGLELTKADKKAIKKLQKEEKKREKEEKKRQKEILKQRKKKGEPIYDVPIRIHNTVPRNYHQSLEPHRPPGLVYVPVPVGRDPASRPPLALPPSPPSRSDLMKVENQVSVNRKLQSKGFHTSAPDLLRVEQVYGRAEIIPQQHPAPTTGHVPQRDGPRTVVLQKGREGFGFVLRGAKSKHMPVSSLDFHPTSEYPALQYLDSVDAGSMAERAGLNSGDFILEINGHNVVQASHERVVELIKASGDTLQLKVITVRPQEKNWFVHQDGCMTLPTRGKGKAPQPPKRNPSTSLSYSKGRSKSFAEGLAEIEKLDQTLAQYEGAGSRSMNGLDKVGSTDGDQKIASIRTHHAAKRVSCIQLDGDYASNAKPEKKTTPPVPPKKYASPSELRIQRYHKKYQQGTLEKARSTPNLANGEDAIYATPHIQAGNGTLTKNSSNRQFSSNGYKTVLSIGSGDSDSSTSSDSVTGIARGKPKQNIYSVPNALRVTSLRAATHSQSASNISQGVATGNNLRSQGLSVDHSPKPGSAPTTPGVVIPPPPRKPAPQPPAKSELVKINTNSSIYANVSADIQAKKKETAESPYESSFRPGTNAKVTKDPDVTPESVEQSKLRHQRKGSIGSLQHAQQQMSAEDRQKFLSFPRHGHSPLEFGKSPSNEGPRSVSFADDKVFENAQSFIDRHPNASLLVTADINSGERRKLNKNLYEPEPDYDADSDDGDIVIPNNVAHKNNLAALSRQSSSSSASSTSNRSDIPVSIHTQTRSLGLTSGVDANTSVTVISVGNDSPKQQTTAQAKSDSAPHYSVNSTIPRHAREATDKPAAPASSQEEVRESSDSLSNQIRMAALARDKRREEQTSQPPKLPTSAPPAAPAPPPAPAIPAAPPAPAVPSEEGISRSRPATVTSPPSAEEIQQAVAERQNRLQNGGPERIINRPPANAGDTLRKKPLDQTQAAILAAVAKRRSVLEQSPDKDIVNQIESRLNKTKKLQSVKYYGSGAPPQKTEIKPITTTPKTTEKPALKTAPKPAPVKQTTTTQNINSIRTEATSTDKSKSQPTSTTNSSNFLALAEKARQEYLQKKNTESPKKEATQTDTSNKTSSGKVPPPPPVKSGNSKVLLIEKTSLNSKVSSENSIPKTEKNNSTNDDDENISIRDKIKSFEKKLDFSSVLRNSKSGYEVRGVTVDDSHTEGDTNRANGHNNNNIGHKEDFPPPMMAPPPAFSDPSEPVSEDVVQIEIIPPPSTFASDDQAGSPDQGGNSAFGHDDSVSLHSSVSTLSTLSSEHGEVSYSGRQITTLDEVIAPPPPGFGDSNYNDNNSFIPPPPEFQENNDSSSKYQNKPFSNKAVDKWNCDDVLDWLESLNMLQYKSRFASHAIDGKRLVELNRNDYIELGVNQVGHRMSLERSIKKLALQKSAVYGV